jgi:hypothetical protein
VDDQNARIVGRIITLPDGTLAQSLRGEPRTLARADQVLTLLVHPSGRTYTVLLHDLGATGLAFLSPAELAVGTAVALRRTGHHPDESWTRTGHVEHCTPAEAGYLIGAVIAPHFTAEEIALLAEPR